MIVVAIDVSGSTSLHIQNYRESIYETLFSLSPPIRVIHWNHKVQHDRIYELMNIENMINFYSCGGTNPASFLDVLPSRKWTKLYVFTDGQILTQDVESCSLILKRKNILLSKVSLHYIGNKNDMNLKFTDLFKGIPQKIYINKDYIGCVEANALNFDDIDYDYVMKDDSLKLTVNNYINSPEIDKRELRDKLCKLECRILKKYFKDKFSIRNFYINRDVEGCVSYVKSTKFQESKRDFQRKMAEIFNLFEKDVDTYSLHNYEKAEKYILDPTEESVGPTEEEQLECEYLSCDILCEKCQISCIPIKASRDDTWIEKKVLNNPFRILESDELLQRVVRVVEPYIMDYKNTYFRLSDKKTSPFTRDELKGVYLLHNDTVDVKALIKHNNYVLSTLFQNRLPGKPVLWHMVFLYILAKERFPDIRALLFKEIRFLGEHARYFVTLSPFLNPPIVEDLNCCFWYLARVCHKAFPDSKKNVWRTDEFISGVLLEFYRDVYDKSFVVPKEILSWQLWYALCRDKMVIFPILSHYYRHEKVGGGIILYREEQFQPLAEFEFLSGLTVTEVLNVYRIFLKRKSPNFYQKLENLNEKNVILHESENERDCLSHIEINPVTCNPYVICKVTGKHWKECVGKYNVQKQSYIRLFKRYCTEHKKYPKSGEDLMSFLNDYIFTRGNQVPYLFPLSLREDMNRVLDIFNEIVKRYTCEEYLERCNAYSSEEIRLKHE